MLYVLTYGCSITKEKLVVSADHESDVDDYGYQSAQDCWYSYDCNLVSPEDYEGYSEEEIADAEWEDMLNDIYWYWEVFDCNNEEHLSVFNEQDNVPFEI